MGVFAYRNPKEQLEAELKNINDHGVRLRIRRLWENESSRSVIYSKPGEFTFVSSNYEITIRERPEFILNNVNKP